MYFENVNFDLQNEKKTSLFQTFVSIGWIHS